MSVIEQARYVDMPDHELLELLGFLWERIKEIDEAKGKDEHIMKVEAELKEYKNEKYNDEKRACRARLKAVRAVAKAKGLQFSPKYAKDARDDEE